MTVLMPLLLAPALLCILAFMLLRGGAADDWAKVIAAPVLAWLRPRAAGSRRDFIWLAMAIVFAALATPAIRAEGESSYALDEGVMVLADVSRSMSLEDVAPSRIVAARAAILEISAKAGPRPAALITYAGDAYLLEPFATDRRQFDAFASAIEVGMVPLEGSNLGRALSLALSVIDQSAIGHARIVLVTDGGGFDAETPAIARRFSQRGHRLDIAFVAAPQTTTPVAADISLIAAAAAAGNGRVVGLDKAGIADIAALRLDAPFLNNGNAVQLSLRSTDWRNLSHWLLLLAVPFMLLAFRQVRA